jgi:excisionase family DNA binding protein
MPRSASPTSALYVRLPAAEADKLDRAAQALGVRKKDLVTGLVSTLVDPESEKGLAALSELATRRLTLDLGDPSLQVGSYSFHPYDLPEVLTAEQAAQLLQLGEQVVVQLAETGQLPGRKLGTAWRFSRAGLVAWLSAGAKKER